MDSTAKLSVGMTVSGTGVTAGQTIASITSATAFELSAVADGGTLNNSTLTFGMPEYMTLGAGEFAFFPWASTVDLACASAQGTPTLEVRIYQEAAA